MTLPPRSARNARLAPAYGCAVTRARQNLGREAEGLAARALERRGLTVLARNVRLGATTHGISGEIDLVALDGRTLVFVEVKSGRAGSAVGPERPAFAVGVRKQVRLRRLARAWLATRPQLPLFAELRFDVVEVVFDHAGRPVHCKHLRQAF